MNQRTDSGAILVNFVFNQLSKEQDQPDSICFWRSQNKSEVDFIWQPELSKHFPVEVKFNYNPKQPLPIGLRSFLTAYRPERGYLVHLGEFHLRFFKGIQIFAIPGWTI